MFSSLKCSAFWYLGKEVQLLLPQCDRIEWEHFHDQLLSSQSLDPVGILVVGCRDLLARAEPGMGDSKQWLLPNFDLEVRSLCRRRHSRFRSMHRQNLIYFGIRFSPAFFNPCAIARPDSPVSCRCQHLHEAQDSMIYLLQQWSLLVVDS